MLELKRNIYVKNHPVYNFMIYLFILNKFDEMICQNNKNNKKEEFILKKIYYLVTTE